MIEPAAYGVPVSFGPNTENFRETVGELLSAEGAVVVQDSDQLAAFVTRAFSNSQWSESIGDAARKVVQSHVGASRRTCDCLCRLIPARTDSGRDSAGVGKAA